MSRSTEIVQRFYEATQAGDGAGILAVLHPAFEARTAPGLPCGAGGSFHGPREAMAGIWGPINAAFATAPYAERWHEAADGTVVVAGTYRGVARSTGRAYEAEFVHLWEVADGRISRLHQYTDTARWHEALAPAA
ncbi:nuclear transport factor 2 family protein [Nonomuraea roseoviolacea]|uniref:Ketosteroid isomerase-like protein n=1 Tax=Nonomuraea roseoviolacea subsp. carminata TaxID=160689 RepID=A0ABT1KHQ0_9ACTN|nr:nuclear transport factor 2 family protein [Nonomuraea roseoviolacea]MCP2352504.1 ketosteroid isomerase-like protein [Nonomuraea roseoviolacea subsp. carminata]